MSEVDYAASRERSAHPNSPFLRLPCSCLPASAAAVSQITTAAIHGTVTDPSGAVVPNAKIAAVNTVTGIETDTLSNSVGFYIFPSLQIGGPYTVTFDAPGFSGVKRTGIMLTVNANLEENAVAAR